jgi:hypothetical protein
MFRAVLSSLVESGFLLFLLNPMKASPCALWMYAQIPNVLSLENHIPTSNKIETLAH